MKRFLTFALAASFSLATAGSAIAATAIATTPLDATPGNGTLMMGAGEPANGIGTSRHNLGAFGTHVTADSTTEICVFCHTPHHTATVNGIKPLWNRGSAVTTFTAYGSTIAGTEVPETDIGSTSLACMSCHDGVTQFDNLVNRPGKDTKGATIAGWNFTEKPVGNLSGTGRLNIGQLGLSNDHPVSVRYYGATSDTDYTGSRAGLRAKDTLISSVDFLTGDTGLSAAMWGIDASTGLLVEEGDSTGTWTAIDPATWDDGNLSQNMWANRGFIDANATIQDLLRNNKVECSSCHDPHFNNKTWNEVEETYNNSDNEFPTVGDQNDESNGMFLRRVGGNTGSGVCRTCHNK